MRESNLAEAELLDAYERQHVTGLKSTQESQSAFSRAEKAGEIKTLGPLMPFFSMRKLRLVFNQLADLTDFEFRDFEAFKRHVLSSVSPHIELSKWQSIASRR